MRALLLAAGVLGLALVFRMSEPAPASSGPVTSDDVQLLSEQMSNLRGPNSDRDGQARKNSWDQKNGRRNFLFGPG